MKMTKRWLSVLLCVIMAVTVFTVTAGAAGGATNVAFAVEKTEVNVGDTFTVTLSNKAMTVTGFSAGFAFDKELLECVSIAGPNPSMPTMYYLSMNYSGMAFPVVATAVSTVDEANANGTVGFAYIGTADTAYLEGVLFTVTFRAKAAGTASFTLYEESNGTDAFKSDSIETKTLTIKEAAPAHTCSENLTHHEAVASTCTVAGNSEYWSCSCGKFYSDANATTEIAENSWVLDRDADNHRNTNSTIFVSNADGKTHQWWNGCSACKAKLTLIEEFDPCRDDYNNLIDEIPDGKCDFCQQPVHICTPTPALVKGQAATCTEPGWMDYYQCDCGKYYEYDDGIGEITDLDAWKIGDGYIAPNLSNHATTEVYYKNYGNYHASYHKCCDAFIETESHDYATGASAHTCICGKVETFKLTVDDMADENKTFEVPYGANILEFIAGKVETGNVAVNTELHKGYLIWTGYWEVVDSEAEEVTEDDVMSGNLEICAPMISTGWERAEADDPWSYFDENGAALIGWNEIDGAWYYFIEDEVEGWHYRAEGLTRVPYPSVEINGVKYAPNQEDIDYFAAKEKVFMDATEAWFIFDENGKFQSDVNGKYEGPKATCYAVNGMIPWHYGLAKITNKYYYFVGDAVNGGNKVADGPVWVTRTNGVEGLEAGACYYFLGGVMANNLTDIVDGKYFENGKYMIGAGLVQVGEDYYYVRSSGKLATGKYYITKTNGIEGFETGMKLYFDETGKMLPIKNGVVEEGGALYFYQNNHMMCGAGLIEYKGAIYYVRSSGKVATGTYYITNTNGMEGFKANDKLLFGEDGKLIVTEKKDGIVEEGGALYYYENGRIAYNAGLLEIENGVYIYVRSNGQLAIGEYYVTNVNGLEGFEVNEKLFFGSDGKLTAN